MRLITILLLAASLLSAQYRFKGSRDLDALIEKAIAENQIPGAVLLAGQGARILHYKAYGYRSLEPKKERMTLDTIFDAASVTKIVATTSSVMKLVEQGKVRLADRVTVYLPGFQAGQSDVTVRHLLTHYSGLRPDVDLKPEWSGYETGVEKALVDVPVAEPGARMIYSDIGFILLGEIVRVASGKPLNEFAAENIFKPLRMTHSRFLPPAAWKPLIAPTERTDGNILRGVVHDPTTRYMGGVAGHAGLFTTARDLSRWARMMLNGGVLGGVRVLSSATVKKFTEPNSPPHQTALRGLGFDMDSPFSSNRGELYPIGSFGHTGFTGTSVWMDPVSKSYVILLANSVHPNPRPAISPLRSKVATIVAAAVGLTRQDVSLTGYGEVSAYTPVRRHTARSAEVQTGIDVLVSEGFARWKGKKAALITNHTGRTRDGKRNIDAMLAGGVGLKALFSPEHGFAGTEDHENVGHARDQATGLPIWSLYHGKDRKPKPEHLEGLDLLVFDIQDIGARFYTYISTMKNAMEAAASAGIEFVVLDRPNPITGIYVEGPMLDAGKISFVGIHPMPLRHGMTTGELARMINAEAGIKANLTVVEMKNWRRADWWDSTGLTWVDPSPNMRSLNAALLYTGVAMAEYAKNYSVGRGTETPFELFGADWMDGRAVALLLNKRMVPGVRFYPVEFKPATSNLAGKSVSGVRIVLTDREGFSALRLGLEIAAAIEKLHPGTIDWNANARLIGNQEAIDGIQKGIDPRILEPRLQEAAAAFARRRNQYLLYK
ncbi:MAG: hypothetical protein C0504_13400 [Candidatus Solibacter sp.]|nr:hypothetical protein [Candidatus Solibacter sp.]